MDRKHSSLYEKIIQGDRVALGQAMTLVESELEVDRQSATELLMECEKHLEETDNSVRFAVSGAPGVGKSTFIETIGLKAISHGHKVGVITIDPTSSISRGSILGDKSRMTKLSVSPSAFIRSSAAGTVLGGMGRRSHEMMTLLAAAGYDTIFAETVGVGQSEHTAWQFTDGFILVLQPGAGDELQGIKRGITELADILIINKADGPQRELARIARNQYENAMHYFSSLHSLWTPKVLTCSATEGEGIDQIWDILRLYHTIKLEDPFREEEKERKKKFWLTWSLGLSAHELLMNHPIIKSKIETAYVALHQKNASLFKTEFDIEQIMKSILQLTGPEKEN